MRLGGDILADEQEWLCLGDDLADELRRDAVALESRNGGAGGFGRDSNQKPAGSLRIEKQIAMFLRNATGESHAIAKEIAVILQSAREKSLACGFQRAGKILHCGVIELQRYGFNSPLGISERHLARVA